MKINYQFLIRRGLLIYTCSDDNWFCNKCYRNVIYGHKYKNQYLLYANLRPNTLPIWFYYVKIYKGIASSSSIMYFCIFNFLTNYIVSDVCKHLIAPSYIIKLFCISLKIFTAMNYCQNALKLNVNLLIDSFYVVALWPKIPWKCNILFCPWGISQ